MAFNLTGATRKKNIFIIESKARCSVTRDKCGAWWIEWKMNFVEGALWSHTRQQLTWEIDYARERKEEMPRVWKETSECLCVGDKSKESTTNYLIIYLLPSAEWNLLNLCLRWRVWREKWLNESLTRLQLLFHWCWCKL